MGENRDTEDEVTLMIENTAIKCKKQDLMRHSDYFKVMFEGCFVERDKKTVKLEVTLHIPLRICPKQVFLLGH